MNSLFRTARRLLRPASLPHQFPSSGFQALESNLEIEEEGEPCYSPKMFYPAQIGEVFNSRYQVIGKLGYGGYSTVWLCRDLLDHKYITLKLCRSDAPHISREIQAYRHISTITGRHAGGGLCRKMLDSFEFHANEQKYPCIVHEPLGMSLRTLRKNCINERLPEDVLKLTLIHILLAVDFLHSKAQMIHADLQENNILLGIEDRSILDDYEKQEHKSPTPRKIIGDRVIHESRSIFNRKNPGRPVLTDFGEIRSGSTTYRGLIQPAQYRAPEVLLEMPWDEKVDIWNVGVMIWDLFEGQNMFQVTGPDDAPSKMHHLAHIVAFLGPPPADFLKKSSIWPEYFNEDGSWKNLIEIPKASLEQSEQNLDGENKAMFLSFVRKMLKWNPEERSSAKDLLGDDWLRDGVS